MTSQKGDLSDRVHILTTITKVKSTNLHTEAPSLAFYWKIKVT